MKARTYFRLAAAICILAILLAGVLQYAAVAGETRSLTVAIPAESDIYIQDYVSPMMSEMKDPMHNPLARPDRGGRRG